MTPEATNVAITEVLQFTISAFRQFMYILVLLGNIERELCLASKVNTQVTIYSQNIHSHSKHRVIPNTYAPNLTLTLLPMDSTQVKDYSN